MALTGASFMFIAYIGPGAGFAFLGSFLILFVAVLLAIGSLLILPFRLIIAALGRGRKRTAGSVRRVVILGLDGLDPRRVRTMMEAGDLPAFAELTGKGCFSELSTTCPPISPVAWSSFATGTNPGKHNIFDFLNRDLRTYIPDLSSSRVTATGNGNRRFGRRRADVALLRKSKPFWQILGEHDVFSTVLRVPVTFPAEPFHGLLLSGMCVPDLRGTQGSFTVFETSDHEERHYVGGRRIRVEKARRVFSSLPGPTVDGRELNAAISIETKGAADGAVVRLCGQKVRLRQGEYSDWVRVTFRRGLLRVSGICRFLLISVDPELRLYVTPINLDPERPAMPISHPRYYSAYLAKLHGPYATLGLAEDTWGLNDGVLDESAFLKQAYDIHAEREAMFLEAVKRTRAGVCCCVFDLSDRLQHMFHRQDPASNAKCPGAGANAISEAYRRLDGLLRRTMDLIDSETVLFVLSDHGFSGFRRGVNLNAWLMEQGYLSLKQGEKGGEYFAGVDWEKTRAYSFGLAGIYLNVKGRESHGIVADGDERRRLKKEIMDKLAGLRDPADGAAAVNSLYDGEVVYSGPYRDNGPDIVVGYADEYRASWECATGGTGGPVFSDNDKHWNGDHCIDNKLVPGVFLCNKPIDVKNAVPSIMDLAPTVLALFGIDPPKHMDGHVLKLGT